MNTAGERRWGLKLTEKEFHERQLNLKIHEPVFQNKEHRAQIEKAHFNLKVDYRLGVDVPQEVREKLWAASHENRATDIFFKVFGWLLRPFFSPKDVERVRLANAYRPFLTEHEIQNFVRIKPQEWTKLGL